MHDFLCANKTPVHSNAPFIGAAFAFVSLGLRNMILGGDLENVPDKVQKISSQVAKNGCHKSLK